MLEIAAGPASYPTSPIANNTPVEESYLKQSLTLPIAAGLSRHGLFGGKITIVKEIFPIMQLVREHIVNQEGYLYLKSDAPFAGADNVAEQSPADIKKLLAILKGIAVTKKTALLIHDIQPFSMDLGDNCFSIDMVSIHNPNKTFTIAVNQETGEVYSGNYFLFLAGIIEENEIDGTEPKIYGNYKTDTAAERNPSKPNHSFRATLG